MKNVDLNQNFLTSPNVEKVKLFDEIGDFLFFLLLLSSWIPITKPLGLLGTGCDVMFRYTSRS